MFLLVIKEIWANNIRGVIALPQKTLLWMSELLTPIIDITNALNLFMPISNLR